MQSFVGKSELSVDGVGEGIVVKNIDYRSRNGEQLFVKLVSDSFREKQKQKAPKDPSNRPKEEGFVEMFLTKARVEKFMYHLVDEDVLDPQFGIEDMGLILKNLGGRIYEDIVEEEEDSIPEDFELGNIRKCVGKKLPLIVKGIITELENVS